MADLPEKYFIEEEHVPIRRSQEYSNMCWSFSMCRAVEIAILRKFKNETRENLRLSEVHAKYSCFNIFQEDTYKNIYGFNPQVKDEIIYPAPKDNDLIGITGAYLSRGSGVVYNDYDKFQKDMTPTKRTWAETEGKPKAYYVTDIYNMQKISGAYRDKKRNWIKSALQAYSGVPISLAYDEKDYNQAHSALYCTDTKGRFAHSALIIGWDDSFPKEYFNVKPPSSGAFLIMDSSITGSLPELAEPYRRCYWLSYEDCFLYRNGYAIGGVVPSYNIHTICQNNYFGVNNLFYENSTFDIDHIKQKIKCKKTSPYPEYVKGISIYSAIENTIVSASIIKEQKGEETVEKVVEGKELKEGGYHMLWAADTKKILLDEAVQSYQVEIELKHKSVNLPYSIESTSGVRNVNTQITPLENGTQFICDISLDNKYTDICSLENNSLGRLSIKVITVPADDAWDSLQTFTEQLNLPAAMESKVGNLQTASSDKKIQIKWSMPDAMKDVSIENQNTIINKSDKDVKLLLMAELTIQGAKEKYAVQKFFHTSIKPARLMLDPITSPEKGQNKFTIKGKSPFGQSQVTLYAKKNSGNDEDALMASAFGDDYDDWQNIKNVNPKADGSFEIQNCSLGMCCGTFSIKAICNGITSNWVSLTIQNPNDVDDKTKTVIISTAFGLSLLLVIGTSIYLGYQYYLKKQRYRMRPEWFIFIRLKYWVLRGFSCAELENGCQSLDEDSRPVIVLEDSGLENTLINEMIDSSITGIDFEIGVNCRLIDKMSENSSLENCRFIYTENKGRDRIVPLVKKMDHSSMKNCQISAEVYGQDNGWFYGIAESAFNSTIEGCSVNLKCTDLSQNYNYAGIANEISDHTTIRDCKVQCSLIGASVAGICIQASNSTITDCQVTEHSALTGTNAGGFLVSGSNTKIQNCQFDGSLSVMQPLKEKHCFGGIASSVQNGCLIESCSSRIEPRILSQDGSVYLGGIVGAADASKITLCAAEIGCYYGSGIYFGGIAGMVSGGTEITKCFVSTEDMGMESQSGYRFGGICSETKESAVIADCLCSLPSVKNVYAAGILYDAPENNQTTIRNCCMAGSIWADLAAGITSAKIHSLAGCIVASAYLNGSKAGTYKISPKQDATSCFAYGGIQTEAGAAFLDEDTASTRKAEAFFKQETYEEMGWDFANTWEMDSERHFPKLKNMPLEQCYPFPFPYVIPPASGETYLFSADEFVQFRGYVSPRHTRISWSLHADNRNGMRQESELYRMVREDVFHIYVGKLLPGEYRFEMKVCIDGIIVTIEKQIKVEKKKD